MKDITTIILENMSPATFISMDTETIPSLRGGKGNPMQGHVVKRTTGLNVMLFQNSNSNAYENMVKRRLMAEGRNPDTFQLSPRKWGVREPNTPFITHNEKIYLEVICLNAGDTEFYLDGKLISRYDIIGLEAGNEPEQAGLSEKVIVRTYLLQSIKRITINKQTYTFE